MPRVTPLEHFGRYDLLHLAWNCFPALFCLLTPTQQWEVHKFYNPSVHMEDEALLKHMQAAVAEAPSLTQKVGRHYRVMQDAFFEITDRIGMNKWDELDAELSRYQPPNQTNGLLDFEEVSKKLSVRVTAIVRPEIDIDKIAKALIMAYDEMSDEDRAYFDSLDNKTKK